MKIFCIAALLANASASQIFDAVYSTGILKTAEDYAEKYGEDIVVGEKKLMKFGSQQTIVKHDTISNEFEKIIELAIEGSYIWDYKQQEKHIKDITSYLKGEKTFKQSGFKDDASINCQSTSKRGTSDPDAQWSWAPVFTG